MNNKKNIILISVVILLFGVSGFVVYKGFFSQDGSVISRQSPDFQANQKNIVNLLPHGTSLDFSALDERSAATHSFEYKILDPANVGVTPDALIQSIDINQPAGPQDFTSSTSGIDRILVQKSIPKQ